MNRPAFKNSELGPIPADWEVKRLGDVCEITTGQKDVNEGCKEGQFPFFTCSKNVFASNSYSFDCEAILVAGNGDVGNLHYFNGRFEAYQRTYVLHGFAENIAYVFHELNHNLMSRLNDGKIGSSIPYITIDQLKGFMFPLPPSVEQRRIAAALSDVDAWIESLDKLIEKKKLVKQGAMQALLSGKTRLPGFSGKWEERPISDSLMPVSSPAGLIKRNVFHDAKPGAFPAFSASGQDVWLSEAAFHGDGIVVSAIGSRCGKSFLAQGDWGVVANTHVLLPKNDACMAYWFYILDNENWWLKAGTGQPYVLIQASLARTMKVPQPAEQRAIAGVLSDMDAELASLSREKVKAERIKEGMMQELLTGKIRL